ncbi:class I SAM-dependent methyltransferase [Myceligenerans pegani]|uniref:Methyltransferase domain-containing protein n=1 Tax=Myceligenerans pegani TaxID=2776917 RepID=A0ABR9N5Z1_9MICO|nr:methyltransferase domain-containing protein [Myceligenerans sp. TRM 65318]MBE1878785.1 methyltransferase domain-containing protein [Myceligenerans sp. TRM 65318]MBE3021056.1 methyltransferase domain-containing protein [Myceligenerans sp. TRM 65318]
MDDGWSGTAVPGAADGSGGAAWASRVDRHDLMFAEITEELVVAARLGDGDLVLDVGCGAGATALAAARRVGSGSVVGADISAPLLAVAAERARDAGAANVRFENADVQVHRLPAAGFDVVLSRFGMTFPEDPGRAWANVARTLRPGGRLAFSCFHDLASSEYLVLLRSAVATVLGDRDVPELDGPDESGPAFLAEPDGIRGFLAAAGFADVEVVDSAATFWMGHEPDDAAEFVLGMVPARALLETLTPGERSAVRTALTALLSSRASADGVRLGAGTWTVTARHAEHDHGSDFVATTSRLRSAAAGRWTT